MMDKFTESQDGKMTRPNWEIRRVLSVNREFTDPDDPFNPYRKPTLTRDDLAVLITLLDANGGTYEDMMANRR